MSKATFTLAMLAAAFLAASAPSARAEQPTWQVCFTPGQDCTGLVVSEIDAAERTIRVRAYSFTSTPILAALKRAHVPRGRVVGISKLARVIEAYAKRLQIQEKMTAQIANTINEVLKPHGVGVIIKATHHCMTTRGVHKPDTDLVTSRMLGCFRDNPLTRQEFLTMVD